MLVKRPAVLPFRLTLFVELRIKSHVLCCDAAVWGPQEVSEPEPRLREVESGGSWAVLGRTNSGGRSAGVGSRSGDASVLKGDLGSPSPLTVPSERVSVLSSRHRSRGAKILLSCAWNALHVASSLVLQLSASITFSKRCPLTFLIVGHHGYVSSQSCVYFPRYSHHSLCLLNYYYLASPQEYNKLHDKIEHCFAHTGLANM